MRLLSASLLFAGLVLGAYVAGSFMAYNSICTKSTVDCAKQAVGDFQWRRPSP